MIVIDLGFTQATEARRAAVPTGPLHALTLLNSSGGAYCSSCPERDPYRAGLPANHGTTGAGFDSRRIV